MSECIETGLTAEAMQLLDSLQARDMESLAGFDQTTLCRAFAPLVAADVDFGALAMTGDDAFFDWMLVYGPGARQDARWAQSAFRNAASQGAPVARLVRLLSMLRDERGEWREMALDLLYEEARPEIAAMLMPYWEEAMQIPEIAAWLAPVVVPDSGVSIPFVSRVRRGVLTRQLLNAVRKGDAARALALFDRLGPFYRTLPHPGFDSAAHLLLQAALESGLPVMAELVFCRTDLLRHEWIACVMRHAVASADSSGLPADAAFAGSDWVHWRHPETGRSLLHLAAELGFSAVVWLWQERGGCLDAADASGETPFRVARNFEQIEFAWTLESARMQEAPEHDPADAASPGLQLPVAEERAVTAFLERVQMFDKDVASRIRKIVASAFDERGYQRRLGTVVAPEALEPLKQVFPLFLGLIEEIQAQLSLLWRVAEMTGKPQALRLTNTLIVGRPGWGKTYFIHRLGEVLGLPFRPLQMSAMSAGFILAGTDPTWSTSRPGMIHDLLVGGEMLNPLILLDEIDKIATDSRHPVDGPLYQLLEAEHARSFVDEYAAYPIDAAHINWFASANDLGTAHPAIVSRFDVYEMPEPTPETARQTALSVYRESLVRSPWSMLFDPEPTADVVDVMATMSPRESHRELKKAFGRASLDGRETVRADDFTVARRVQRKIGFVN